ncbi:FHA domain-containing protein [Thalassoglobus sp. JC818]|uniref:FHA domain-containing protein n=1 Tax=Thalassoglobus sp. JC818 TaxID=3232136 RepID=UPI003458EA3E
MAHPSIPSSKTATYHDKLSSNAAVLCLKPLRSNWELDPVNLAPGRYLLGRGRGCDLVFDFDGVAEKHALLVIGAKRTILQAYSPMTWVNDGAVNEETVSAGDRIALGPIEFLVEGPAAQSSESDNPTGGFLASDIGDLLKSILFSGRTSSAAQSESIVSPQPERDEPLEAGEEGRSQVSETDDTQEAHEKLRLLQEQLDRNQNDLEAERKTFESQRLELQDQLAQLEVARQEIANREEALSSREMDFEQQRSKSQSEAGQLSEVRAELDEQKQELVRQREEFLKQKAEVESLRAELEAKAQEQREAKASLEAKEGRLNQDAADWTTRRSEIDVALQNLQEREVELSRREEELNSRGTQAEIQLQELTRQSETLQAERAELEQREKQLSEAERDLEQRQQQATQQVLPSVSDSGLTSRDVELESRCQTLVRLVRELKRSEAELRSQLVEFETAQQAAFQDASQRKMEFEREEERLAEEAKQLEELRLNLDQSKQELEDERNRLKSEVEALGNEQQQLAAIRDELAEKANQLEQAMQQLKDREESLRGEIENASVEKSQDLESREQQLQAEVAFQQRRLEEMLWTVLTERDELEAVRATLATERENLDQKLEELHRDRRTLGEIEQVLKEEEQLLRAELDKFADSEGKLEQERGDLAKFAADLSDWSHTLEAKESALLQLSSEASGAGEASTSEPTGWRAEFEEAQATLAMQADQLRVEQTEIEKLAARIEHSREHLAHRVAELERREQILGEMEFRMGVDADEIANGQSPEENNWSSSWDGFDVGPAQDHVSGPVAGGPILEDDEFESLVEELASTQIEVVHDQASDSEADDDVDDSVNSPDATEFAERFADATDGIESNDESEGQEASGLIYDFAESEADDDARDDASKTQSTEGQEMISDDEVRAKELRAELSQAFGMGANPASPRSDSSSTSGNRVSPSAYDSSSSETESRSSDDSSSNESSFEDAPAEDSEEISIDSYMERLLSRTSKSTQSKSKVESAQKAEAVSRQANSEQQKRREPTNKAASPRPSDSDRKELRQKLDSFRAVANHSARQAVANSMADRERLRFEQWKQTALMGWGVTLVLVIVSLLLFHTLSIVSYLAIGAAFVLTLNAVISYRSLSQLLRDGSSEFDPEENPPAEMAFDDDDSSKEESASSVTEQRTQE